MLMLRHLWLVAFVGSLIVVHIAATDSDAQPTRILEDIESDNILEHRSARTELAKYLEGIDEQTRSDVVKKLLDKAGKSSSSYRYKLGVYYGIGRIRRHSWTVVDDLQGVQTSLYRSFQTEKDPTLKKYIDAALMTSKGLYWDAIKDYNTNNLNLDDVRRKFENVFEIYQKSTFAPRAHCFLARYYTRVYLIQKQDEDRTELPELDLVSKSNEGFEDFFNAMKDGRYKAETTLLMEARYFLALNFVLLGNIRQAISELRKIESSALEPDDSIYVHQFYFSYERGDVVNKRLPTTELVKYTRQYLQEHPQYNDNYLRPFTDHLRRFSSLR